MLSHVDDEKEQALIAMMPPHESLLREVADDPDAASSWSVQMTDDQWIGAYNDHPVVNAATLPNAAPSWCSRFTSWPQGDDTWHSQCARRNYVTADAVSGTRCTLASIGRWLPCPKAQCPRHATTKHRGVLKTSNAKRYKVSRWDSEHASLWTRRTTAEYARECDRSEIWVVLQNEAVHREVRFKLKNSTVGRGK